MKLVATEDLRHAANILLAAADGKEIQFKSKSNGQWITLTEDSWYEMFGDYSP